MDIPEVIYRSIRDIPDVIYRSIRDIPDVIYRSIRDIPDMIKWKIECKGEKKVPKFQIIIAAGAQVKNGNVLAVNWQRVLIGWRRLKQKRDFLHRRKMERILLAYSLLPENVLAIMMIYKSKKAMVRLPDRDNDFLDIVAGVLRGYKLVLYLSIICLVYVLRTSIDLNKENGLAF